MADWIKAGGALPNSPELARELTTPTYTFFKGKLRSFVNLFCNGDKQC